MSESGDITSYSNEDNNITHEDQLEFSSLHASLISDVEGEDIAIEFNSAPSSPSSLALRDISPLRTASVPSSPRSGSSVLPRTSSVKALVNQFENNPSIMAANAKKAFLMRLMAERNIETKTPPPPNNNNQNDSNVEQEAGDSTTAIPQQRTTMAAAKKNFLMKMMHQKQQLAVNTPTNEGTTNKFDLLQKIIARKKEEQETAKAQHGVGCSLCKIENN